MEIRRKSLSLAQRYGSFSIHVACSLHAYRAGTRSMRKSCKCRYFQHRTKSNQHIKRKRLKLDGI